MKYTFAEVLRAMEVSRNFQAHARNRYLEFVEASGKGFSYPDRVEAFLLNGERVCIDAEKEYFDGEDYTATDYHSIIIPFDKLQEEGAGAKLGREESK